MITIDDLRDLRHEILQLAQHRKAKDVRVLGSIAKGTATEASDVDFVVRMDPSATLIDLIGLQQDLEHLLGCHVDIMTDDAIPPYLADDVQAAAIRL